MHQTDSTIPFDLNSGAESPRRQNARISERIVGVTLIVSFLGCIFVPPIYQTYYDMHVLGWSEFNDLVRQSPTAKNLEDFEKELIDGFRIGRWIRHTVGMAHGLNYTGIVRIPVIRCDNGFLFLQEEFERYRSFSLLDPSPAPTANLVHAIEDYSRQLRQRGIHLVVLPVPLKASIYPELIWPDYRASDGPAYVPSYQEFLSRLHQDGVDVLDVSPELWAAKNSASEPIFIKDDTHWSWRGRGIAADVLAEHIQPMLAGCDPIHFDLVTAAAEQSHDLRAIIGDTTNPQSNDPPLYLEGVYQNGKPLFAGNDSPVLLLGDSYSEIGSTTGASLASDLIKRLHMGVQMIAWPGAGMSGAREKLQNDPSALTNKKIVIWEFAGKSMWENFLPEVPLPPAAK
jgi:alginate O-acetyltransferase complex protein AlgJ